MSLEKCPLCGALLYRVLYVAKKVNKKMSDGSDRCRLDLSAKEENYVEHRCAYFNVTFAMSESIVFMDDDETREKLCDLMAEHLLRTKYCEKDKVKYKWHFHLNDHNQGPMPRIPEYIDLTIPLKTYPIDIMDKAHRILVNLSLRYPHYGDVINLSWRENRLIFEHETNNVHTSGMMQILEDLGYVKDPKNTEDYIITAAGWQKIEELRKNEQVVRQAFIAMIFREEARSIREAFRRGIEEMGYHAVILDEKEHNNQIVPEIFYEIKRSKFVVVDVTYPSYGAYYEAGYAQALGKEVIVCCREAEFDSTENSPHFDIAQKAIIKWKDEAELVERLKRRIEATVT